jgi:hypothetical protein
MSRPEIASFFKMCSFALGGKSLINRSAWGVGGEESRGIQIMQGIVCIQLSKGGKIQSVDVVVVVVAISL